METECLTTTGVRIGLIRSKCRRSLRKAVTRLLAIPLVLSICSAEESGSASLESLKARFQARYSEIHRDELEGPLEKLEAQYLEAVSELKKSASAEGNLDLALAAERELKAFAEKEVTVAEGLPELETLQKIYRNQLEEFKKNRSEKLNPLVKAYVERLDKHILSLTQTQRLGEAAALREEREQVKKLLTPEGVAGITPTTAEAPAQGSLHAMGSFYNNVPVSVNTARDFDDFIQVVPRGVAQGGWTALRANGKVVIESSTEIKEFSDPIVKLGFSNHLAILPAIDARGRIQVLSIGQGLIGGVPETDSAVHVAYTNGGGGSYLALLRDGTVKYWGAAYTLPDAIPPPEEALSGVRAIEMKHVLAYVVKMDGSVISWQPGSKEEEVPGNVSNVVELAACWDFCVARTERGKVIAWGGEGDGRMAVPQRLRDAVRIRAYGHCGAAQQEDGSWLAWGDPINGVVEKINSLGPVVDLAMVASQASNPDFYGGYVLWIE